MTLLDFSGVFECLLWQHSIWKSGDTVVLGQLPVRVFKGLCLVNTELNNAFRILTLSMGVSFKILFSLRGAMPTESVHPCLMKGHNLLLPFLVILVWCDY